MNTPATPRPGQIIVVNDNPQIMWTPEGTPVYVKYQAKYKMRYILCSGFFFGLPGIAVYCCYKYSHGKKKDARLRRDFEARYASQFAYEQPVDADDYPPPFVSHQSLAYLDHDALRKDVKA